MGLLDGGIKQIVGNALTGIFLDFTLIQKTITEPTNPWESATSTETSTACKAINAKFKYSEIDGERIKQEDRKIIILAEGLSVVPTMGDLLKQSGETRRYEIVSPVMKDAAGATYTCHCR